MKKQDYVIRDEAERLLVKTILGYTQKAEQQNRAIFTDFYNVEWLKQVVHTYIGTPQTVSYSYFGGYEGAERQQMCISPFEMPNEAFELGILKISVKAGLGKPLTHRDYLGSLLGLGIDRKCFGDIIVRPFGAYVVLTQDMIPYVKSQLLSIGRYQKIELDEVPLTELQAYSPQTKEINITVSSLRLDVLIAGSFGLSRSLCDKMIQSDKVKKNGQAATASTQVKVGDVLTLRGYGKVRLKTLQGQTKKNRLRITIEKFI